MQDTLWIDTQTKAVVTSFLVYNPSIDLYILTSIVYEFPSYGSIIVDQTYQSLQPIRLVLQQTAVASMTGMCGMQV